MNICLYGASSTELDARYLDAAYDLGRRIAAGGHTMVYGGGAEGPAVLVKKLQAELADTMAMCGAHSLADIDRSMLFGF